MPKLAVSQCNKQWTRVQCYQSKASRHFAQPSLSRFGEKNAQTKTNR